MDIYEAQKSKVVAKNALKEYSIENYVVMYRFDVLQVLHLSELTQGMLTYQ